MTTDKFKKLKNLMKTSPKKPLSAGLQASKDPKKFLEKMKNPSLKGLKGFAF